MDSRLDCGPNVPFTAVYGCAAWDLDVAGLSVDFRRFLHFFKTRIPLSTCFSWSRNGGRNRNTESCVLLNKTPSASACSTSALNQTSASNFLCGGVSVDYQL